MLILGGTLALVNASLSSASEVSQSMSARSKRSADFARTEISLLQSDIAGSGTNVDISVQNTGQTKLRDFEEWDVVISYYDTANNDGMNIVYMEYTTNGSPNDEQWTVEGIYTDSTLIDDEVYEPDIFNPGEAMKLRLKIDPSIPSDTDNVVTIGVNNGVRLQAPFSR
jgi:hypothetical protein